MSNTDDQRSDLLAPCPGSVAVVGEDGWRSAGEPPDSDRLVEIAWEDGSHGNPTLGFYDGIAEIPDSGRRWWWEWSKERGFHQITLDGAVLAWRERQNDGTQRRLPPPLSNDNTKNENGGSRSLE